MQVLSHLHCIIFRVARMLNLDSSEVPLLPVAVAVAAVLISLLALCSLRRHRPGDMPPADGAAAAACTSLAFLTLPEGLTSIGEGAFSGCTSLASLTLPECVSIGVHAFEGCTTLASGSATLDHTAFDGCSAVAGSLLPQRSQENTDATASRG